jgi:V8-like Glu-specific endopeptidase
MLGKPRAGARKPGAASRVAAVLAVCLFAICGLGVATALGAGGEGRSSIVVHSVHSRPHLRAFWTAKRLRGAEPLPLLTYSRPGGHLVQADGGASPATLDPSADGTDTGDPTVFPNRANGIVFFFYDATQYRCSGSVVDSPAGDVVLTAGHCVIAPASGAQATDIVFIPGYRDGAEPFGEWPATSFVTTAQWQSTSGSGDSDNADEAGDIAMLTLANRPGDGATIQSVVGAVGIGFNQPRNQTYMEYGYPAGFPYQNEERLYELTSPLAGNDSSFTPATMAITSDFTGGSSGGPWLVGSPPVALSVNDYKYSSDPNHMYGPYFGSIAQQLYATATTGAVSPASSVVVPPKPSNAFTIRSITLDRLRGMANIWVKVPGAGTLKLRGHGLVRVTKEPAGKATILLPVRSKGSALATLRDAGRVDVEARIAYTPSGGDPRVKFRSLVLLRHD